MQNWIFYTFLFLNLKSNYFTLQVFLYVVVTKEMWIESTHIVYFMMEILILDSCMEGKCIWLLLMELHIIQIKISSVTSFWKQLEHTRMFRKLYLQVITITNKFWFNSTLTMLLNKFILKHIKTQFSNTTHGISFLRTPWNLSLSCILYF